VTSTPQTPGREIGPPSPALATHPFVPFSYGDVVICAEAVDGRCCGRAEGDQPAGGAAQAEE
jgi:hypothetical protein